MLSSPLCQGPQHCYYIYVHTQHCYYIYARAHTHTRTHTHAHAHTHTHCVANVFLNRMCSLQVPSTAVTSRMPFKKCGFRIWRKKQGFNPFEHEPNAKHWEHSNTFNTWWLMTER